METPRDVLVVMADEMRHQRELWDAEYLSTAEAICFWTLYALGVLAIIAGIVVCSVMYG